MIDESLLERLLSEASIHVDYSTAATSPTSTGTSEFPVQTEVQTQFPDSLSDPVEREPEHEENQPIVVDVVRTSTARFSGAVWFNKIQEQVIIVGGQGGISSWFTFLAARMFPRSIYTYDPDRVEMVNLAGQLFSKDDIGMYKGEAVARTVNKFSEYGSIFVVNERFTQETNPAKIMVCGFDNMEARKAFYLSWKGLVQEQAESKRKECLFIDGRLAAESLQILCISGDAPWDMKEYEDKYLFTDSEAEVATCSFKQTAFMANMIAALMVNMLANFCANLCGGCRTIPFYTQYEADQMYMKLEGGV